MSANEELARIRVRDAIKEGLQSQKYQRSLPKKPLRNWLIPVLAFLLILRIIIS